MHFDAIARSLLLTLLSCPLVARATLITVDYTGAHYDDVTGDYTTDMYMAMSLTFDSASLADAHLGFDEILAWDLFDGLLGCDSSRSDCVLSGSGLWGYTGGGVQFGDDNWGGMDGAGSSWLVVDGAPGLYTRVATARGTALNAFDDSGYWAVRTPEPGVPALLGAGVLAWLASRRRHHRASAPSGDRGA